MWKSEWALDNRGSREEIAINLFKENTIKIIENIFEPVNYNNIKFKTTKAGELYSLNNIESITKDFPND